MGRMRLGRRLIRSQIITESQLENALHIQEATGKKIGEIIVEEKYATEKQVVQALAKQFKFRYIDLTKIDIDKEMIEFFPKSIVAERWILPLEKSESSITIIVADPLDSATFTNLEFLFGCKIEIILTHWQALTESIKKYYQLEPKDKDDMWIVMSL